ncbi:NAD(P)H-binding protein [Pseudonocardia xinjiangensis]|uniref:NAD(P)H-binding protein n=1 Tax=Pseudonocardia xinjiangensis TaxID=75289 RepID=UPI003D8F8D6B
MTILVTGGGGGIGRRVVAALAAAGHQVRATAREATTLRVPDGVDTVSLDLTAATVPADVFDGVDAVFLYPVLGDPGPFLAAARAARVDHTVLLSSPASFSPGEFDQPIGRVHQAIEAALDESGLPHTVLYPSWLASNTVRDWAGQIRSRGRVALESPEAQMSPIHPADVASVAAHLLTRPEFRARLQILSGPESLTLWTIVDVVAEEIRRPVGIDELTREQALAARPAHLPEAIYRTLLDVEADAVGVPALLTNGVARITGRPPRPVADWVRENRAAFVEAA